MKINDDDLDLLARAKEVGLLSEEQIEDDDLVPDDEEFVRLTIPTGLTAGPSIDHTRGLVSGLQESAAGGSRTLTSKLGGF